MRLIAICFTGFLLAWACSGKYNEADAWGSFEADELIITPETQGKIIRMDVVEGNLLKADGIIAIIDTTMLWLQRKELLAAKEQARAKKSGVEAQAAVIQQQKDNHAINLSRTENLLLDGAATQQQMDDLNGQMKVLNRQEEANNTQLLSIAAEINGIEAKQDILDEQLNRSIIRSPVDATVIEKYASAYELASAGRPLIKLANLSIMKLKVWISGAQLSNIVIGDTCIARIDEGDKGYRNYTGTISHVSEKAEFTPKIIQTKEERVSLVYAVTILVPNDGSIKAGMPGEAIFQKK